MEDAPSALNELKRCVRCKAIGLGEMRPSLDSLDNFSDNLWTPLVNYLTEHNLLCLLHASEPIGHLYPGKGDLTPAHLYRFIARFPKLKIVMAHWGGGLPFYNLMPDVKEVLSNTWFDSAASPFLYDPSIYSHVSQIIDAEHILFGSDYPLLPHSRALKDLNNLAISNELKQAILGNNANKLLDALHAK
jgi:predicted TIM-barrel fold metal-dependent hydrolase